MGRRKVDDNQIRFDLIFYLSARADSEADSGKDTFF